MFIKEALYRDIIQLIPILCVDIIIKNEKGQFLLIKRSNQPLKGEYWLVGGRINHGENARDAARRKLIEEVNIKADQFEFIGIYEGIFDIDPFDNVDITYHTIGLLFQIQIDSLTEISLDNQSSEWKWSDSLPEKYRILKKRENLL